MYIATLSNRFPFANQIEYTCTLVDDEGIMPDRVDNISIPEDRDTERYLRSVKNGRCAYWEEEYYRSLPIEEFTQLPTE